MLRAFPFPGRNRRLRPNELSSLALTAALVTGVERMDLTVLYEKDLFHSATEGANRNSD